MADIDKSVRKQVFGHLLDSLDRAISAAEDETSKLPGERRAELILGGGKDVGPDLATLRAQLGAVRHEVAGRLERIMAAGGGWDVSWNERDEANLSQEVRFSINVMHETITRIYGQDLEEFRGRWATIERKKGISTQGDASISFYPLDFVAWNRLLTTAQTHYQVSDALQTLIFLQLEQDAVQHLGFLLFDLNHRLSERGIGGEPGSARAQHPGTGSWEAAERGDTNKSTNDEALFGTIMNLLENWTPTAVETREPELYAGGGSVKSERPLNQQEVMATILTLQQWVPKVLEDAIGSEAGQLGEHIRDLMIKQAEALGVPAGQATISEEDSQAVDLVDEAFTNSLYQRRIQAAARQVMAQILFPSVKAAILNRHWFADINHPARKFISATAEAVAPEHGEMSDDTIEKARETVNKLVSGFNEDVSIFEHLTNDLQEYIASKQRRVDPEEEAREDAERLVRVREELKNTWPRWKGPAPVMAFVLEVGGEHLARLDKAGQREHGAWGSALSTLDSLLHLESTLQRRVVIDGVLRESLMTMLTGSGWTGVRAHARLAEMEDAIHAWHVLGQRDFDNKPLDLEELLSQEIRVHPEFDQAPTSHVQDNPKAQSAPAQAFQPRAPGPATAPETTKKGREPVVTEPAHPKVDELVSVPATKELAAKSSAPQPTAPINTGSSTPLPAADTLAPPSDPGSDVVLSKIQGLKVGSTSTWINASNEMVVLKLSWISPISQKYLFVNKDGARALAGTPKELAGMAHKGRFFPGVTP